MSEMIYIQDDFGNRIPLLDEYGNLSVQVLMLYTEDKLSEADRKTVNDFAATDEMAKDALEGFALTSNPAKTRYQLGQLNSEIQKKTGASALAGLSKQKADFDYRKLAAAIVLLVVIGGTTFFGAQYFTKEELADNVNVEKPTQKRPKRELVRAIKADSIVIQEPPSQETEQAKTTLDIRKKPLSSEFKKEATKQTEPKLAEPAEAENKTLSKAKDKTVNSENSTTPANDITIKAAKLTDTLTEDEELAEADPLATTNNQYDAERQRNLQEEVTLANKRADMVLAALKEKPEEPKEKREQSARNYSNREAEHQVLEMPEAASTSQSTVASFPGGDIAMYKFIERKKIYTEAMKALNLNGTVTITFNIETDGRVSNAKVKSGNNGLMNEDALRVVRSMPAWNAAKNANGAPVRSSKSVVVKYGN